MQCVQVQNKLYRGRIPKLGFGLHTEWLTDYKYNHPSQIPCKGMQSSIVDYHIETYSCSHGQGQCNRYEWRLENKQC